MGFLDWLFGTKIPRHAPREVPLAVRPQQAIRQQYVFPFVIYDADESIAPKTWYQRRSWNNKQFVQYRGEWNTDWIWSEEGQVKVAGISHGTRAADFLQLAPTQDFTVFLEPELDNPVNPHARKVMAAGTLHDQHITRCIGYLPDSLAIKYAGVELAIHPHKAFLPPTSDLNVGVEIALLVRSARYLKRRKTGA